MTGFRYAVSDTLVLASAASCASRYIDFLMSGIIVQTMSCGGFVTASAFPKI